MMNVATLVTRCLSPVLLTAVALSSFSVTAQAGNMYIYKDTGGQVLLTNVSPSGNFDKFTKKVKVTYYKDSKMYDGGSNNYGSSASSNSGSRNSYDSYIRASAARHGVDPALIKAMMHTESAFNPNARSPVGAQGLMQLMPATARRFKVSNAWNPAENIEGSAKYIAWLMKRFNNNVEFAIAGYNAGEGNVDKYNGIPPFKETRNYVQRVMSRYHSLYKNDAGLTETSMNASNQTANPNTSGGLQNVSYATNNNTNNPSYANSAYAALR
ncbi:lytic transglycosylase domain-containing protein [Psychrobacter sp. AOP22-C1-22]|uniref:lytic transglycosylase domain-containing protein n=1 Tax=unclassified Psychrobacter TaxID=196806 RepID=UPI00178878B2|nr:MULTISPECIES: lytic transglycosylase domain-containing protein [unclassified Psychrobacter]MBE0405480.1 lytic transglycosylase domain-containing protein [Psychrobacter sp. FME6]MBE0444049.1 lytic transglycosylase domain-containing protein [Psychrobacter sp. FME5]MDN5802440.1 lytic transglycosylase domain-containing protein [Psychrobacter sp.]MDN5891521.1 lytic transglycosylase domain-containing protein [Psychrobacter sp.]